MAGWQNTDPHRAEAGEHPLCPCDGCHSLRGPGRLSVFPASYWVPKTKKGFQVFTSYIDLFCFVLQLFPKINTDMYRPTCEWIPDLS